MVTSMVRSSPSQTTDGVIRHQALSGGKSPISCRAPAVAIGRPTTSPNTSTNHSHPPTRAISDHPPPPPAPPPRGRTPRVPPPGARGGAAATGGGPGGPPGSERGPTAACASGSRRERDDGARL